MVLSFLLVASLMAEGPNIIEVPKNSPFSLREAGPEYGSSVYFEGEITLQANFVFEWNIIDDSPDTLEARIVPDKEVLELFPFAENSPPIDLRIMNAEEAAGFLLKPEEKASLLKAKVLELSGAGSFRVGGLVTSVECDSRSYGVTVVSARVSEYVTEAIQVPPRVGC